MNQKKMIIVAVALIAVIVVAVGAIAAILLQPEQDVYTMRLSEGYRYLQEGDYNNAILQFRLALEEDDSKEDAYLGLYQAYLYAGQWEYAQTTLRVGIRTTQSTQLEQKLTQLIELYGQYFPENKPEETEPEETEPEEKDLQHLVNIELLTALGSANYGDYCAQYGTVSGMVSNGRFSRYIDAIGATLIYYDTSSARVIDSSRGVPYSQFLPNEIWVDSIATIFGGSRRVTFDTLRMLPGVRDAVQQGKNITFVGGGCEVTVVCEEEGVITDGCANKIVPLNMENAAVGQYQLQTVICDATNNAPISNVRVRVYKGNALYGECKEGMTDGAGTVSVDLTESGEYTVVAEKEGYISEQFQVIILSGMQMTTERFYLSPVMQGESIRFVLTWDASPTDLDSHLSGYTAGGNSVYVFFGDKTAADGNGKVIADLDLDDTDGYGPETMTLHDTSGSFDFVVDDYTNSGTISFSGATVKIYVGSTLYTTVNIPAGIDDQWHVCRVVDGEILVTNRSN